jgi:Ras-related protein Rab-7A
MIKVVVIGDSNVGKSSVLNQFVNREFSTTYRATVGTDTMSRQVEIDGKFVTLHIWDTAGQERFKSLSIHFYRGAQLCVLVYDITSEKSFTNLDEWHGTFLSYCGKRQAEVSTILLGNKYDMAGRRAVEKERAELFAKQNGMLFFEVSAKTSEGIVEAFEAGVKRLLDGAQSSDSAGASLSGLPTVEGRKCQC